MTNLFPALRVPPSIRSILGWIVGAALVAGSGGEALAREYSTAIEVHDEQELRQLYYDGLLEDEEYDHLLRLLESPVDLNRAERFDLYQLPGVSQGLAEEIVAERITNGPYLAMADLALRLEEVNWRLIKQIEVFVVVRGVKGAKAPVRGAVDFLMAKNFEAVDEIENDYPAKSHTIDQLGYGNWPTFALSVSANALGWIDVGLAGTAQESLAYAVYEPTSRDIHASWGSPTFRPYMAYVRLARPEGQVVAGNYHLHFGNGLVMSSMGGRNRHGFFLRESLGRSEDRIREFDGFLGVAARKMALRAGPVEFDLSVFSSLRNYDQYISYVGLAGGEELDPLEDEVSSPRVWIDGQKTSYLTLPNVFRIGVLGGNASVRFNRRTHVGFTGYAAFMDRTVMDGVEDPNTFLIRQRWPSSAGFGTVGIHGAVGFGLLDLSGEWGMWLNEEPAQALYFAAELEPLWGEFVLSLRHYDIGYANPFNRGESAPDRVAGISARGEQGIRFKATLKPISQLRAALRADLVRNLTYGVFDFEFRTTVTGKPTDWLDLRAYFRFANQNLAVNGREHRYGGAIEEELLGEYGELDEEYLDEETERAGERITLGGTVRLQHRDVGNISFRYKRDWIDAGKTVENSGGSCELSMQQGQSFRIVGRAHPHKTSTIGGGFFYADDDVQGEKSGLSADGSHSAYGYVLVEQRIKDRVKLRLRGGIGKRLPDTPSGCDEGDAIPLPTVVYEPTDYQLRAYGDLLFTMRVTF